MSDDQPLWSLKSSQLAELAGLEALLSGGLVERFGVALDGGAHVGGWTAALAKRFESVLAFEPARDTFELLARNVGDLPNVEIHQQALMHRSLAVQMIFPRKSRALTSRCAEITPAGECQAVAIDDLGLERLDFLKLDLEGAEPLAIEGAARTLRRCRPFVVIEEFNLGRRYGFDRFEARRRLERLGFDRVWDGGPNQGFRGVGG